MITLYDELVGPLEVVPQPGGGAPHYGQAEAAHVAPGPLARLSLGEEVPDGAGAGAGARHHDAQGLLNHITSTKITLNTRQVIIISIMRVSSVVLLTLFTLVPLQQIFQEDDFYKLCIIVCVLIKQVFLLQCQALKNKI